KLASPRALCQLLSVTLRRRRQDGNGRCPIATCPKGGDMLVLCRKIGERVWISPGVILQVLSVNGRTVRICIPAPPEVPIWRKELLISDPRSKTSQGT